MGTKKSTAKPIQVKQPEPTTFLDVKRNTRGEYYLVEIAGNNERTLVGESSPRRDRAKARALRVVERFRGRVLIRIRDQYGQVAEVVELPAVAPAAPLPARKYVTAKR